jgi:hypothetical protein
MSQFHERYCHHCGGVYLATSLDEAVLDAPLCLRCMMALSSDDIAFYWGKRAIPAHDRHLPSQARESRN